MSGRRRLARPALVAERARLNRLRVGKQAAPGVSCGGCQPLSSAQSGATGSTGEWPASGSGWSGTESECGRPGMSDGGSTGATVTCGSGGSAIGAGCGTAKASNAAEAAPVVQTLAAPATDPKSGVDMARESVTTGIRFATSATVTPGR